MKVQRVKLLSLAAAMMLLPACSTIQNGATEARSVEEEHPISVDQQTITVSVAVDPSLSELTSVDKSRLRAFADTYFKKGHGAMTITAPSGGRVDFYGQEVASDIRQELYAYGVDWSKMNGATYRVSASTDEPEVIVSFTHYVATAPGCGDWSKEFTRRFKNIRTKNFGCAAQRNLAAMISDPYDLIEAAPESEVNTARILDAHGKYTSGQPTSSSNDTSLEVSVSE